MITTILISVFLLFFPIFIKIDLNYKNNFLFFNVKLFNFIKIIYGHSTINNLNILVFYNKNKFKQLKLTNTMFRKNNFGDLSEFSILNVNSKINFGGYNLEYLFGFNCLFYVINNLFCEILKNKYHYLKIKNNFNIHLNEEVLSISTKINIIINLFAIIFYFITKFKRKILNERKI